VKILRKLLIRREWEKVEKVIGSAVVATTETTLSDHSVIVANNHVFSLIPKPLLIPSGFLVSAIGSAPVSYLLTYLSLLFSNQCKKFNFLVWILINEIQSFLFFWN
jgi:hypothetical protein